MGSVFLFKRRIFVDKLSVIRKTEELGGKERRTALEQIIRIAHKLGCASEVGGGRIGGINFRYGSIRYAIMDVNVEGEVKLYVQPHPNKTAPEDVSGSLNGYIKDHQSLSVKSFPLTCYGHLENRLEEIEHKDLVGYLERAVQCIRDTYYRI